MRSRGSREMWRSWQRRQSAPCAGHVLRADLCRAGEAFPHRDPDDLRQSGDGGNPPVFGRVFPRGAGRMVSEAGGRIPQVDLLSASLEKRAERFHGKTGVSFSLPGGQRRMVTSVYHTISTGKQIFIQAPTGVGKTMSTIFPAVRCVGEGKEKPFFILQRKPSPER